MRRITDIHSFIDYYRKKHNVLFIDDSEEVGYKIDFFSIGNDTDSFFGDSDYFKENNKDISKELSGDMFGEDDYSFTNKDDNSYLQSCAKAIHLLESNLSVGLKMILSMAFENKDDYYKYFSTHKGISNFFQLKKVDIEKYYKLLIEYAYYVQIIYYTIKFVPILSKIGEEFVEEMYKIKLGG